MRTPLLLAITMISLAQAGLAQDRPLRHPAFGPGAVALHQAPAHARGNAPANDDCANAQVITMAADCSSPVSGDNTDATQDGGRPGCEGVGTFLDVWYVLDPGDADTIAIQLTPADADAQDWSFAVYGACGGTASYCVINPAVALDVPVVPNANNWIRVWSNTSYAPGGPFTLCVAPAQNLPVPPNDVCGDVVPQAVAIGSSRTFTGTNIGAINNEAEGVPCVWEAFSIAACADVHISYCGTPTPYEHFMFPLYTSCDFTQRYLPGSYTRCGDGNFILCYSGLPAGTYHYPVLEVHGSVGPYTLTVSAEACGTDAPANDECTGATPLAVSATCSPRTFSPACASQSMGAMTCDNATGLANDDVWYRFTATQSEMSIGVLPHGDMDPAMQVFSGSCGSLTPFACMDVNGSGQPDDLQMTGLTAGSTYYVRVYDFRAQYAWADPSYDLCVVEGLGSGVGVGEQQVDAGGSLFPNPTSGTFIVRVDAHAPITSITILDAMGRVVLRKQVPPAAGMVHMDAHELSPGRYMVRCEDGSHVTFQRLVVVR
ncbi:MAG: T9SS type A sorting domain-containing protein [Flavobacteriales bacterium]